MRLKEQIKIMMAYLPPGYWWRRLYEFLAAGADNPDDTDKDGIPNYADVDDDGDSYGTKIEINNPATGLSYPFADIPSCDVILLILHE
jgi:hypothetical protein